MVFTLSTTHGKSRRVAGLKIEPRPALFCVGKPPRGSGATSITQEQHDTVCAAIKAGASIVMQKLEVDERRGALRKQISQLEKELDQTRKIVAARDGEIQDLRQAVEKLERDNRELLELLEAAEAKEDAPVVATLPPPAAE